MQIAIIGAGPTGLVSAKHALEQGFKCDVFEQTGVLGGTWVYTDQIGNDENGLPVHTSMYEDLMTNLPKEVMAFSDYPYPFKKGSYRHHSEVLHYFKCYADHFNLQRHIKFHKYVTNVKPLPKFKWVITIMDAKTKTEESKEYDAVFVCNGHYRETFMPEIPGQNIFKGTQSHSHDYRNNKYFAHKKVLVRGAGPSGRDISELISKVAKHVFLSYKGNRLNKNFPNVTEKPAVTNFTENEAVFEDGTTEQIDIVLYCTGYKYSFPFLTEECGIKVDDNWVNPLYKQIINIEHPTMYFIGLPDLACVIPMFDLQARFALAALGGKFRLPSKEDMLKELEKCMAKRTEQGILQRHAHRIGGGAQQQQYFKELATTADLKPIPPVISKLFDRIIARRNHKDCFEIVDEENFKQVI